MFGVLRASKDVCFVFHVSCASSPYSTFVLVCLQGRKQELIVEKRGTPSPIKLNVNFKWIRYSRNHPPLSFCRLCLVDHHFSYVFNRHHSNMFGFFYVSWVILCFVCISLVPFCSCLFIGATGKSSLIKAKEHQHQHLQAQHLLQMNKTCMDSPPWSSCSIIGHFCLVDRCCQFIWSFECIHCPPPIFVFVYVFSISNAFPILICALFPCSPCVLICLQGKELKEQASLPFHKPIHHWF